MTDTTSTFVAEENEAIAEQVVQLQERIDAALALLDYHLKEVNTIGSTAPNGGMRAIRAALTGKG